MGESFTINIWIYFETRSDDEVSDDSSSSDDDVSDGSSDDDASDGSSDDDVNDGSSDDDASDGLRKNGLLLLHLFPSWSVPSLLLLQLLCPTPLFLHPSSIASWLW